VGIDSLAICKIESRLLTVESGFPSGFIGGLVKFGVDDIINPVSTK